RATAGATAADLSRMLVGSERMDICVQRETVAAAEALLRVGMLRVLCDDGAPVVKDVSFEVRAGDIFGIDGLTGKGEYELVEALTGLRAISGGTAYLRGQPVNGKGPRQLYAMGLAHVPEDRHRHGMVAQMTVMENTILGVHHDKRFRRGVPGTLHWGKV